MSETTFWGWVKDFRAADLHQERVENASNRATPDVEGQIGSSHYHLELKVLHDRVIRNREEEGRIKFEVGQRDWAQKRWSVGGTAYILIGGFREDVYLIPGAFALVLPRLGMVKTSFLLDLCWWFCEKKNPETRADLYGALRKSAAAHRWAADRLQQDQRLREASLPPAVHPVVSGSWS